MVLIIANMTSDEMRRFHEAGLPYSGSTGAGATFLSHGKLAPYIVADADELFKITSALGWSRFTVTMSDDTRIVRSVRPWTIPESLLAEPENRFQLREV